MDKHSRIMERYAESLSEVYLHIKNIGEEIKEEETEVSNRPLMWFRGHAMASYNLIPSIFRGTSYQYNSRETYSNNHLREDYRFQSFMSRNFDNVDLRMPQSVVEWQEVMQHFFTKTRLMDWSESVTVALEFALEAFINPIDDLETKERRRTADPVIWILRPDKLNNEVYNSFAYGDTLLIKKVLDKQEVSLKLEREIQDELCTRKQIYFNMNTQSEQNMNAMLSLSSLEIIRNAYKGREMEAVARFEINPFFYLLLRYYSDGIPVEMGKLPPLAIIHPYHSQRIKLQKGVFTVFPYYIPDLKAKKIREIWNSYQPIAMEYMSQCIPWLYRIRIMNPQKVADELMVTGAKRGNLYPDMQIISQDMENVVN